MVDQMNKKELLTMLESERSRWDDLIATLSKEQLSTPGVVGQWSVKDMISHLTTWESRPIAWLEAVRDDGRPQAAPWSPDLTEEQVNAWIWQTNRERPLDQVLAESKRSHQELVSLIRSTSEEDLITPKRFSWATAGSVAAGIPANTYEHYREHGAQIRSWLEKIHSR